MILSSTTCTSSSAILKYIYSKRAPAEASADKKLVRGIALSLTPQRFAQHVPRPKPSQGARLRRQAPIAPQAEQPEQATSWRDHGSALAQWKTTSLQPNQRIALLVGDILRDHVASANSQASCASDFEPLNAQN